MSPDPQTHGMSLWYCGAAHVDIAQLLTGAAGDRKIACGVSKTRMCAVPRPRNKQLDRSTTDV